MVIHASEAPCFPWWSNDMKEYRYDILIELLDNMGDTISEDYESFSTKEEALKRIDYINNQFYMSWDEYGGETK